MNVVLLTFGQALEALKAGKKVAREGWGGYWMLCSAQLFPQGSQPNLSSYHDPMLMHYQHRLIVAILKDTKEAVAAQPYQADMLAEDWLIVE